MKRYLSIAVAVLVIAVQAPLALAHDGHEGHEAAAAAPSDASSIERKAVTMTGEVIDTWCYFQEDAHGQGHKACATNCAKHGIPLAFLDAQGKVYLINNAIAHTGTEGFRKYLAENVEAKGTLIERGGMTIFYVDSMKKVAKGK